MPNWHAAVRGNVLHLVHSQPDQELDRVGAWDIVLWRGAPSWESDPELEHAALGVMLPSLHKGYLRHSWVFDIPDRYLGAKNTGDDRAWMTLQGGSWTIVLRFPPFTPAEVYRAVAAGFHAQLGGYFGRKMLAQVQEDDPDWPGGKASTDPSAFQRADDAQAAAAPTPTRPLNLAARAALL